VIIKKTGKSIFASFFVVLFFLKYLIEAPAYLIDLMQDKNKEVRRVCDMTLEIISVSCLEEKKDQK
jgi:hypothetical protein